MTAQLISLVDSIGPFSATADLVAAALLLLAVGFLAFNVVGLLLRQQLHEIQTRLSRRRHPYRTQREESLPARMPKVVANWFLLLGLAGIEVNRRVAAIGRSVAEDVLPG